MAIALVNLTFDIGDLINTPAAPSGTKVWIETNIDGDVVIDPDGNVIRLGLAKAVVGSNGAGSFVGLVATNAATNPTNFQYKVHVDYRLPYGNNPGRGSGHDGRGSWDSGWFSLTTSQDLADVVAEQYVPPTFITQATADLQAMIDQGLKGPQGNPGTPGAPGGSDAATAGFVSSGPLTSAALSASIEAVVDPAVAVLATKANAVLTGTPTLNGVPLTTLSNLTTPNAYDGPAVLANGGSY